MKFTALQTNFAKALNQVSRVVATRTTLPVLSNILITAEKSKIKLSATDLEVAITAQTVGKVEEEGSLTIPARLLNDFILNNTDESIDFTTEGTVLKLKSKRFEANIHGISAEEFPSVPAVAKDFFCEIEKEVFIEAIKKVVIATANDETRPVLAGVLFSFKNGQLVLAATDSYRLAEKKIDLPEKTEEKSFIVPARTMNEVVRLLSSLETKNVAISPTENQISFKIGETQLVSRLIEGSFPNYSQIIPKSAKIKITAKFNEFQTAIKMIALFAKDGSNNIKIRVKDGKLSVNSAAGETGNAASEVEAQIDGGDIEISFNVRYVSDIMQVIAGQNILLEFNDEMSAGVIKSEKDKDFVYIVMPLRIDN